MKLKIFLYPEYMDRSTAATLSPEVFSILREYRVRLEVEQWSGKLDDSLASDRPGLVLASEHMLCSQAQLAMKCAQFGHFVFYNDKHLGSDGNFRGTSTLVEALTLFLEGVPA